MGGSYSLQENNNLCTLGLTMVTRDNFLVIGPHPPPPTLPNPHFCGFVSRFGRLFGCFLTTPHMCKETSLVVVLNFYASYK